MLASFQHVNRIPHQISKHILFAWGKSFSSFLMGRAEKRSLKINPVSFCRLDWTLEGQNQILFMPCTLCYSGTFYILGAQQRLSWATGNNSAFTTIQKFQIYSEHRTKNKMFLALKLISLQLIKINGKKKRTILIRLRSVLPL